MAIDLDAKLETEPVRPLAIGFSGDVHRRITANDLPRIIGIDLDAPAETAQLRDRVGRERAQRVDIAVDRDHVVHVAAGRDRAVIEVRELDRAEALEYVAGLRLC